MFGGHKIFFKEVSYAHQGYINLIKNRQKLFFLFKCHVITLYLLSSNEYILAN